MYTAKYCTQHEFTRKYRIQFYHILYTFITNMLNILIICVRTHILEPSCVYVSVDERWENMFSNCTYKIPIEVDFLIVRLFYFQYRMRRKG